MLKIYLARHGQDEDNAEGLLNGHRDRPLTEKGIAQAKEVAEKIRQSEIRFDVIYASPLQRAFVTAEMIAGAIGGPIPQMLPDLIERDFGVMSGLLQAEIEARCAPDILKTNTITYFLSPEGAETFPQLLERATRVLKEVASMHADGSILLVTHGDLGKMIYAAYYQLEWLDVLQKFHFGNSELLELSATSSPEETHVFTITQHNH